MRVFLGKGIEEDPECERVAAAGVSVVEFFLREANLLADIYGRVRMVSYDRVVLELLKVGNEN